MIDIDVFRPLYHLGEAGRCTSDGIGALKRSIFFFQQNLSKRASG
eukprot:GSA120T00014408001.1